VSAPAAAEPLHVDLVDGTYELFRHFYAPRAKDAPAPQPGDRAAVRGVLGTVVQMLEGGATHVGVATDHVIESFRNDLWPGYKTGDGIDPALWDQFHPLEEALVAMGVETWAMVKYEADDALAAAAALAAADPRVASVRIWTPDKDLAQCVEDRRVVQVDRRSGTIRDADGVRAKFGVAPASIPDWLALVGDSADGYPGIPGFGAKSAAAVLAAFGRIEDVPTSPRLWPAGIRSTLSLSASLEAHRHEAALFKVLATLRREAPVSADVDAMRWRGPHAEFAGIAEALAMPNVAKRVEALAAARA
jgi:5'-3' exonuclease